MKRASNLMYSSSFPPYPLHDAKRIELGQEVGNGTNLDTTSLPAQQPNHSLPPPINLDENWTWLDENALIIAGCECRDGKPIIVIRKIFRLRKRMLPRFTNDGRNREHVENTAIENGNDYALNPDGSCRWHFTKKGIHLSVSQATRLIPLLQSQLQNLSQ